MGAAPFATRNGYCPLYNKKWVLPYWQHPFPCGPLKL